MINNRKFDGSIDEIKSAAIYSRKSKYTGIGESTVNQINMCKEEIKRRFPDVLEEQIYVYEDEGFSGGNTNRPNFQQMMQDAKDRKFGMIFCYKIDRVSRNVADFYNFIEKLDKLNIKFKSTQDNFDTTTPGGKAMMGMAAIFAQMERETIAQRITDNMYELAKTGRWLGGNAPTGYASRRYTFHHENDARARKAVKLEIVPDEAEVVKQIFAKYIETSSLSKVETLLMNKDIKSKTGKAYRRLGIRSILRNPVYLVADQQAWSYFQSQEITIYSDYDEFNGIYGIMAYNKTRQTSGASTEYLPMKQWLIAVGRHEGLISGQDWVKVQSMLDQNTSKSYRKPKSTVALLSGLLRCVDCGSFMRPKQSQRLNADNETIYSYLCEQKEVSRSQKCRMKNPNGNMLDKSVCEYIKSLSEDKSDFLFKMQELKASTNTKDNEIEQELSLREKQAKECKTKIEKLILLLADGEQQTAAGHIHLMLNDLDKEHSGLQSRIEELKIMQKTYITPTLNIDIVCDTLSSFATSFDTMSNLQKRSALRMIIDRIVWDGETAHIFLFGSDDDPSNIEYPQELLEPQRRGCK